MNQTVDSGQAFQSAYMLDQLALLVYFSIILPAIEQRKRRLVILQFTSQN